MVSPKDIDCMKYNELQHFAKNVGIKANMKAEKLRNALKDHFQTMNEGTMTSSAVNQAGMADLSHSQNSEQVTPSTQPERHSMRKTPDSSTWSASAKVTPDVQPRRQSKQRTPLTSAHCSQSVKPQKKLSRVSSRKTPESTSDPVPSATQAEESVRSGSGRRKRKGTFEGDTSRESSGIQEMKDAMQPASMTDEQMKESLLQALDKRIQAKKNAAGGDGNAKSSVTQIPRFMAYLAKQKQDKERAANSPARKWERIHNREFEKMDSLDTYLEKKRKRTESMTASAKKIRKIAEQRLEQKKAALTNSSQKKTPNQAKLVKPVARKSASSFQAKSPAPQPFVPSVTSTSQMNLCFGGTAKTPAFTSGQNGARSCKKATRPVSSALSASKPFVPSVKSTSKMNVAFGSTTKTPIFTGTKSNGKENITHVGTETKAAHSSVFKKSIHSARKSPNHSQTLSQKRKSLGTTLSGSEAQPTSQKKHFDLRESLARPVTWKMYTGKLPSFQTSKLSDPKEVKVKTLKDRRNMAKLQRNNARAKVQMNRRGLVS